MENDSIRASGSDTLVDIWIEGKVRAICVTQAAIGASIGFDKASAMTDEERCDFVRRHLPQVVRAAKAEVADGDPDAAAITIDESHPVGPPGSGGGERRRTERRKADRRKVDRPASALPHGERRRADRRKGDRRTTPKK